MRILIVLSMISFTVAGQRMATDSVVRKQSRYYFSARAGMTLCGECEIDGPTTGYINVVQGIRLSPGSRLGIGTGLMSASQRVIVPIFGSFKFDLGNKRKNRMFVETNLGSGAALGRNKADQYWSESIKVRSYFQPSIGYSIKYHDLKIGIMLGMQWLNMVSTMSYPSYGWIADYGMAGSPNTTEFKYNVSRMTMGLSIGWND